MIHGFKYPDANAMHEGMCERLMMGSRFGKDYDWTHGTEVGLHNAMLGCESFNWSFDLKRLWMPRSRWHMMVRQYIDPTDLERWKDQVADRLTGRGRGIAVMRTRPVQGYGQGKGVRRRWGSCMLNLAYRSNPTPTISLHSRTTYFGYLAAMDITVAHVFAREAGAIVGIEPKDMQFIWTLDLAQFHGFRSLAWPLGNPLHRAQMDADVDHRLSIGKDRPGYRKALDGYDRLLRSDRVGKLYGDEAFSSFARVRRRFHTEIMGSDYAQRFTGGSITPGTNPFPPLPSVSSNDLDFSCLGQPEDYAEIGSDDYED